MAEKSNITVTVDPKKNTMTIVCALDKPTPSKSGKTLVIASTRGGMTFENAKVAGKPVILNINAYIKPTLVEKTHDVVEEA